MKKARVPVKPGRELWHSYSGFPPQGGGTIRSKLPGQLGDLLGAVVREVDGKFLVLTTGELDRPLLTHGLTIAGHLDHDFVVVPGLASR